MKKLALLAGTLALAACAGGADTPAEEEAMADGTGDVLEDLPVSEGLPGTYEVTREDGTVVMSVLSKDGTYVDSVDGEVTESGIWAERDEQVCFDPDGEEPGYCTTNGEPDEDGVFQRTADDGGTVSIRKVI